MQQSTNSPTGLKHGAGTIIDSDMNYHNEDYHPPTLVVDAVIFYIEDFTKLKVLLIKRANEPFKESFALPGAYANRGKTTLESTADMLSIKAGVDAAAIPYIEQIHAFDTVARDPRGHAVSICYMGLGYNLDGKVKLSANTHNPQFFDINLLPDLAYDHKDIIGYAYNRLASEIFYTDIVKYLLPLEFTFTELQNSYQAILGRDLDKRNFRKKINILNIVEGTNATRKEGAHRPAKLFKFIA